MRLLEGAFRGTLQVQIRRAGSQLVEDGGQLPVIPTEDVWGFGSGFLIVYRGILFFITADHNVHPEDYDADNITGQRTHKDYLIDIITNNAAEGLSSLLLPISKFLHLTGYNLGKDFDATSKESQDVLIRVLNGIASGGIDINDESIPIGCRIQYIIDIAVAEFRNPMNIPLLSNKVVVDGEMMVEQGAPKLILQGDMIDGLQDNTPCIVAGTIHNELRNGDTLLQRANVFHRITFDAAQSNSQEWFFRCEPPHDIRDWKGLSGAPVFREDGLLVGMLVNGPGDSGLATVIPINRILGTIDYQLLNDTIAPR